MNTDLIDALVRRPSLAGYDRDDLRQDLIAFVLTSRNAGVEATEKDIAREFRRLLRRIRRHVVRQLPLSVASPPALRESIWEDIRPHLTDKEYYVIYSIYSVGESQSQVANRLKLTQQRVHQIKTCALEKLRKSLVKTDFSCLLGVRSHGDQPATE